MTISIKRKKYLKNKLSNSICRRNHSKRSTRKLKFGKTLNPDEDTIHFFKYEKFLDLNNYEGTYLPDLPNVEELIIKWSNITNIGHTPLLSKLIASFSKLKVLESYNVEILQELHCSNSDIEQLPDTMEWLEFLYVSNCPKLVELPNHMPNLIELSCSNSNIRTLPNDMSMLQGLTCDNTPIERLPAYMPELLVLICNNTLVTKMPTHAPALKSLNCNDTPVTKLPENMPNLRILYCNNTRISKLPENMPELQFLQCTGTFIYRIPTSLHKLTSLRHNLFTLSKLTKPQNESLMKVMSVENPMWENERMTREQRDD